MAFPSNPAKNFVKTPVGRIFLGAPGSSDPGFDVGEGTMQFSLSVKTEQENTVRDTSRAVVHEQETERTATAKLNLREWDIENMRLGLYGSAAVTAQIPAGSLDGQAVTTVSGRAKDLGQWDLRHTRLTHATPSSGTFTPGQTVTGGTSSATGKIAWAEASAVCLVAVSGTFVAGETLTEGGGSGTTAQCTSAAVVEDVVLTDHATTPTKRYAQGTDYRLDPQYGYLTELAGGTIAAHTAYASADYPARTVQTLHGLAAAAQELRIVVLVDRDSSGPRRRYVFHRVSLRPSGDVDLIGGSGLQAIVLEGTVLKDTSKPAGQEYLSVEYAEAA